MSANGPRGCTASYRAWTPSEDAAIRARFAGADYETIAREIGRTRASVFKRARRLGLLKRRTWTPAEDERLRRLWGEHSTTVVAKRLGRSGMTVYWRAQKLGLPLGCPEGMEYVRNAALRTGFDHAQLTRILAWAVETRFFPANRTIVRRGMSRPLTKPAKYRFAIVDPLDVDDAIAAWLQTETRESAAKRRGLSSEALEYALVEFGQDVPEKPAAKKHWRIHTGVIDAALAARAARETLKQAARRLGIRRDALSVKLRAARVAGAAGRPWRLLPADVDRAVGAAA